jgi:hypothetical protein
MLIILILTMSIKFRPVKEIKRKLKRIIEPHSSRIRELELVDLPHIPDYLEPPYNEEKMLRYVLNESYDLEELADSMDREYRELREERESLKAEIVITKSKIVREIFETNFRAEYHEENWINRADLHTRPTKDEAVINIGNGKVKEISWDAVLRDPYPYSDKKFDLSTALDDIEWHEYYKNNDYAITQTLRSQFSAGFNFQEYSKERDKNYNGAYWKIKIIPKIKED